MYSLPLDIGRRHPPLLLDAVWYMTFAMSTETDSVKSALSEANDKNATDNHTDDSSQDSVEAKEAEPDKPVENNVKSADKDGGKAKDESTEGESEQESELPEKREVAPKDKGEPEENDNKSEGDEAEVKKVVKPAKSEEDEEGEEEQDDEEEEEVPKKADKPAKESKNAKEPKEKDEKASTASEKDEEDDEAEDDEGEEKPADIKGKKKGVPLLDQPLETSGKRERKNVQRFEEDAKKEPQKMEFEEGSGTALGEIPRIEASIARSKGEDLKLLHRLLFKVPGTKVTHKKNIKRFNGFAFERDSEEYKKKLEFLRKSEVRYLKLTCDLLDLPKAGSKDELVERILEFLLEPKDSGKPVGGTGRPKRASAVRANNRGYSSHDDYSSDERHAARSRRDKGKRANLKDESSSDEEFKPGNASDASDDKPRAVSKRKRGRPKKGSSEEDEASLSGVSSDESDDLPRSKRRKSITKSNSSSGSRSKPKTPSRRGRPAKGAASAAATPRGRARRGRKAKEVSSDEEDEDDKIDDGSSSEDEPLAKKKAKTSEPPTDDEIKTFIKSVLEGANLEEITMKTVCQRVYDNYPDFDLTARKNFIKSTVKSLIST